MKQTFSALVLVLILVSCDCKGQCSKNCTDKKCRKMGTAEESSHNKPLACKLTTPELNKRKAEVIEVLKTKIMERKSTSNGVKFKFKETEDMLDSLTTFIEAERQCCDFFGFTISIAGDGYIWLEISGPQGAKEFITTELGM